MYFFFCLPKREKGTKKKNPEGCAAEASAPLPYLNPTSLSVLTAGASSGESVFCVKKGRLPRAKRVSAF